MSLQSLIIPAYTNGLKDLAGEISKAADWTGENGMTMAALLEARLAPDMFPLETQIQFTCHQAREAVARLTEKPVPDLPQVTGPEALQALIETTISELEQVPDTAFEGAAERQIRLELPNGMVFEMTGFEYVRDWAQAQFYFHRMAAYAIMRHVGVPLGKADYVAHMSKYMTSPG